MKKITILGAALAVVACTLPTPERPMPRFSYTAYPPTNINVGAIEVQGNYQMPMRSPNVEHLMPMPLPQAVTDWARHRFKAVGNAGTMVIRITQAGITGKNLPRTEGVEGWFTVDQAERYDARIIVEFSVEGTGDKTGSGVVNVTRSQTVAEDASVEDRDAALSHIEELALTDLDASAQKMLQERLAFVLR